MAHFEHMRLSFLQTRARQASEMLATISVNTSSGSESSVAVAVSRRDDDSTAGVVVEKDDCYEGVMDGCGEWGRCQGRTLYIYVRGPRLKDA